MEYPHGHVNHHSHHHNHHHRDDDDNHHHNNPVIYPPPPLQPPFTHSQYPPPPLHGGVYPPPPPPSYGGAYNPPPPQTHVESPNYPPPPQHSSSHHFHPHVPNFIGSHFHHGGPDDGGSSNHSYGGGPEYGPGMGLGELVKKPSMKINCKAGGERYAVGIRDGKLVLMHPDHTNPTQHWYKDEKYSTKVKDKDGHPSFILVNKGTEQAVKHSISCHPVQLAPYRPDVLDESVLWTESRDLGSGFRTIRTVNNIHLVMDAWNADKDHGGIHDGTVVALYETWKGDNKNQQWKFARH